MIDPNAAWELIRRNAIKAMHTNMVWHSLVENAPYRLIDVLEDHLLIKRLDGGDNQKLTKNKVMKAVEKLNTVNGIIKRRTLISPTVAEETAFVLFHPQLGWDENGGTISSPNDLMLMHTVKEIISKENAETPPAKNKGKQ